MKAARTYLPCDEWLYLKIYTGHRTADLVLSDILYPAWLKLHEIGQSDTWFFIRYGDPDFHLRFRLKLNAGADAADVVREINQNIKELVHEGLVWKIELGTYIPEIERYGEDSMECAEQIFCADSHAFIKLMNAGIRGDEHLLWLYALASVDRLLGDFKYTPEERKELMLDLSRSFGKEFGKNKALARQLSDKFRTHRGRIRDLLSKKTDHHVIDLLEERSANIETPLGRILGLYEEGKMRIKNNDLLSSFIHMSMNRIFSNNNRLHEMVIYDLLFRHYKSMMFRD